MRRVRRFYKHSLVFQAIVCTLSLLVFILSLIAFIKLLGGF
jgi:hypothetical protein